MARADRELNIRNAVPDDAEAIARLSGELGYPTTMTDARRRLFDIKTSNNHAVMVAEDGAGTVVGWIHVFRSRRLGGEPFAELGGLVEESPPCPRAAISGGRVFEGLSN